ncbi:MAG: hypothetical protein K6T83_22195, partial [Alicyclobacillus sp.]|nr:hypothetical protein [Alicyclobacillus sp.]
METPSSVDQNTVTQIQTLLDGGVWLDPLLVRHIEHHIPQTVQTYARQAADNLREQLLQGQFPSWPLLHNIPCSPRLMQQALFDALLSTAAVNEPHESRLLNLTEASVDKAVQT